MINYAGLGRIPFPTMDIKILKTHRYNKGNKARHQAKAQQSTVKNSH